MAPRSEHPPTYIQCYLFCNLLCMFMRVPGRPPSAAGLIPTAAPCSAVPTPVTDASPTSGDLHCSQFLPL